MVAYITLVLDKTDSSKHNLKKQLNSITKRTTNEKHRTNVAYVIVGH